MSTPYNRSFRPSFPTLMIYLRNGDTIKGPFLALLDTGADVTFVPLALLEDIEALEAFSGRVRSHFGESRPVQLYVVAFQVENLALASSYVVADEDGDDIILGRDVLNKLPLFLDGASQQTNLLNDVMVNRIRNRRQRSV
ncbi:MAG: aspartyl protease family protein [Candidatus Promineifilaceae bacterium]